MIIQNAKTTGSLQMNRDEVSLRSRVYIPTRRFCVFGRVFEERLKPGQTFNAHLNCAQWDRVNESLIKKYPAIVNRKGVIRQHDHARPHCARRTLNKINELGWGYCLTHHTRPISHPRISIYSEPYKIFLVAKNFKIWMRSKMPSRDILLKNPIDFYRSGNEKFGH